MSPLLEKRKSAGSEVPESPGRNELGMGTVGLSWVWDQAREAKWAVLTRSPAPSAQSASATLKLMPEQPTPLLPLPPSHPPPPASAMLPLLP